MRLNKKLLKLLPALLLVTLPFSTQALEDDKDKPIEVEADTVEINDNKRTSTYKGNVILTQGSIRLKADSITVIEHETKSNQIKAWGRPLTITQTPKKGKKPVRGRSQRLEYFVDSEIMYLIGNAILTQGKDTFKSDRIAYDRKRSLIKGGKSAKGKSRVKVTIKNKKKKKK